MPKESLQKKIGRVRPPRVQITYDVEIGDAIEKRDLPFVVGVLADLSGMPNKPLPPIEDTDVFDTIPPVVEPSQEAAKSEPVAAPEPSLVINNPKKESIVKKGRDAVARDVNGRRPRARLS